MSAPGHTSAMGGRARGGFSLLEALVAIALVVGLSGGVMSFLFNLWRQRDGVERGTDALRGAAALLEGLEGDVLGAVAGDGSGGAGIVGGETSLRMLTRSVAAPVLGDGIESVAGDLQGVEYVFDEAARTLSASRWDAMRADRGQSGTSVLAEGVSRVRLRYFDGTAWRGSFDSGRDGGLPVAIEVAVWFGSSGVREVDPVEGGVPEGAEVGFPNDLPAIEDDLGDPGAEEEAPVAPPDRVRLIVIPDGPVSAWREGP